MKALISSFALLGLFACHQGEVVQARLTTIRPESGENVWAEMRVKSPSFGQASIIPAAEDQLKSLAAQLNAKSVAPGREAKYVQVIIFVESPNDPNEKLGTIRFPLRRFMSSGGSFNAADLVQFKEYGAQRSFCIERVADYRPFCQEAAKDPT